jgi:TfoX/Sxy family transcriptional regulator of competence genes
VPYDEQLAERIRWDLERRRVPFEAKEMMGGLCVLVDGKMLCGVVFDKKAQTDLLMVRIGEDAAAALRGEHCRPMDFTGRAMKGYLFVTPGGFDADDELSRWIDLCLAFNPKAKKSRK